MNQAKLLADIFPNITDVQLVHKIKSSITKKRNVFLFSKNSIKRI